MAGRPTKYNDEMQAKADQYIVDFTSAVPSRQGLALYLDVSNATIDNWEKQHDAFLGTLERIKNIQFQLTLSNGLTGDFNASIAKLLLHNHGLSDKTEVDNKSTDGSMATGKPTKIELIAYEAPSVGSTD